MELQQSSPAHKVMNTCRLSAKELNKKYSVKSVLWWQNHILKTVNTTKNRICPDWRCLILFSLWHVHTARHFIVTSICESRCGVLDKGCRRYFKRKCEKREVSRQKRRWREEDLKGAKKTLKSKQELKLPLLAKSNIFYNTQISESIVFFLNAFLYTAIYTLLML